MHVTGKVVRIDPATRDACIDGEPSLHARTVILATGSTWRDLEVGGRERGPFPLRTRRQSLTAIVTLIRPMTSPASSPSFS